MDVKMFSMLMKKEVSIIPSAINVLIFLKIVTFVMMKELTALSAEMDFMKLMKESVHQILALNEIH